MRVLHKGACFVYEGHRFFRLTVIGKPFYAKASSSSVQHVVCECECGQVIVAIARRDGRLSRQSCGCLQKDNAVERVRARNVPGKNHPGYKHGLSRSRLKRIHNCMLSRCYNPRNRRFSGWGGRGIKICSEWHDFLTFHSWATASGYSDELTIDRIDNNGDYEPSNCKWATQLEQARNRRNNTFYEAFGEVKTLREWSRDERSLVANSGTLLQRLRRGMSMEEAISTSPRGILPSKPRKRRATKQNG